MTWWITDTSIGQRLKFVRRFRRLTQKELGLLMGYSEKTADVRIAQYEKNARTPNAETTAKLAEVLKVSPVVFSPTICASREDLLQSMYWLFLMKGGGDIYDRRSGSTEEENGRQPLGIPQSHRRADLPGQCAAHAPPGAETGGPAQGEVP